MVAVAEWAVATAVDRGCAGLGCTRRTRVGSVTELFDLRVSSHGHATWSRAVHCLHH